MYLDQGNWVVSIIETNSNGNSCSTKRQVMTLSPPLTVVKLQPACSGFSSSIKLPPYFKQYSKAIEVAFQIANPHVHEFTPVNICIWKSFDLQNLSSHEVVNLRKLSPVPEIPINDLKSKIAQLKSIHVSKEINHGCMLWNVIMVSVCAYWRFKKYSWNDVRSAILSGIPTDSVDLNVMHIRIGASRTNDTVLGQEAVRIMGSGAMYKKVPAKNPVQGSVTSALLDQLKDLGIDVS